MIRMRRVPPKGVFRRKLYEIELPAAGEGGAPTRKVTSTPVTAIHKVIGVGDAWTLVRAADEAWDGRSGQWVALRGGSG